MPYIVNFTDSENKTPITVFDNTSSTDTSLTFPGRNVTGYGQIIAENFLGLLENFASSDQPVNPIEGQLWYDSTNGVLQIWDNTAWKAASNIQKGPTEPSVETSKIGELWVDTTNQQLRIFTGTRWILVGPQESSIDGLRYGPAVEQVADSDNVTRSILTFYIADVPVIVFSKDSFTPKISITGYQTIRAGMNINVPTEAEDIASFVGGFLPKVVGTATSADNLNINNVAVSASKFLRTDQVNTTEFGFNVRNNAGLTIGTDGNFNISTSTTAAKIYNSSVGSSLDLQTNRNGVPTTILRITDNKIGINKASPDESLDVDGNILTSGTIVSTDTAASTNLNNGSIRTAGGIAVTKNILVGDGITVSGTTTLNNLVPSSTETYDVGTTSLRWNNVRAKKIIADEIEGVLNGNINGNANTATNLKNVTSFQLAGDVISPAIQFDGQVGSYTKIFTTSLTSDIINTKDEPFPASSESTDYVLIYRDPSDVASGSTGLLKQSRDNFVADLGIPIGTILPFAGNNIPSGFLLCDGGEVEIAKYRDLYNVIGTVYNGTAALIGVDTFRIPDLRGRFALGKDNMDNGETVPLAAGGYTDAGGGTAGRVADIKAQTLGGDAGASSATLEKINLPDHRHDMKGDGGTQFYGVTSDTAPTGATAGIGAGTNYKLLGNSGDIVVSTGETLQTPVGIMNPYLTINYIIRSGPALF